MHLFEIGRPIKEYFAMRSRKEISLEIFIPILMIILYPVICLFTQASPEYNLVVFFEDIINQMITVMALFISFTMAYLSILITSNSSNIIQIKKTMSKDKKIGDKPVTLFQILLCDITYIIIVEVFYLCLVFSEKFALYILPNIGLKILMSIDIGIFIHILIVILLIIKNTYFIFWNPEEQ